ncbi:hypothetical protein NKG94_14630 [Micromonospora sp. M12]
MHRHRILLPLSGIAGVIIVLGSDVLLRAVMGGQAGWTFPPAWSPPCSARRSSSGWLAGTATPVPPAVRPVGTPPSAPRPSTGASSRSPPC